MSSRRRVLHCWRAAGGISQAMHTEDGGRAPPGPLLMAPPIDANRPFPSTPPCVSIGEDVVLTPLAHDVSTSPAHDVSTCSAWRSAGHRISSPMPKSLPLRRRGLYRSVD